VVLDTACRLCVRTTVPRPSSDPRLEGAMDGHGSGKPDDRMIARAAGQRGNDAERSASDSDQTASDADQTAAQRDEATRLVISVRLKRIRRALTISCPSLPMEWRWMPTKPRA
jgi:hypothetical protein